MSLYAEVIVPLPLGTTFTYSIPERFESSVVPMSRVVVQFGTRKLYTAIVVSVSDTFLGTFEVKPILEVSDPTPILRTPQLKFWFWLADYYMCPIGDVMRAALPAELKIESETYISLEPDYLDSDKPMLTPPELEIRDALLTHKSMSLRELAHIGAENVMSNVQSMLAKGAVSISERAIERFKPKKEIFISVTLPKGDSETLKRAFDSLSLSGRRQNIFTQILKLTGFMRPDSQPTAIPSSALRSTGMYDTAVVHDFEKKGLIKLEKREISRFRWDEGELKPLPTLSPAQDKALDEIHRSFIDHAVTLLHGVTSSGKTEIFIRLIDYVLRTSKRQVLYLVPEIALTTQLTKRLQDVFGRKVVIYHSRFTDAERVEIWRRLLNSNKPLVVIGARSSVFLPFANLGLVIVDEEHEQSYKQFDPAPRYNGRDAAMVLASMHGAKTLLASATPSVESYYKATEGRYGLVSLTERFSGVMLPAIEIVDMSRNAHNHSNLNSFSERSIAAVRNALGRGEQAIIFHNRRGYSPIARCKSCEFIPKCTDCDVSLTYHRRMDRLVCHYCGKEYAMPSTCPVCHEPTLEIVGYGTERIEDDVDTTFSDARVLRMDLDTTRNKDDYSSIIDRFSEHKADILVGTQMVTKGLDFGDVSTVIVVNADLLINYPEFRAAERAFNMLEQVSGRAGRRTDVGLVIIQTRQPEHPVLGYVLNHEYTPFFGHEIAERQRFAYPPFVRLVYIVLRSSDASVVAGAANELATRLRALIGNRVFGPHEPTVNRVKTMYIRRIMIKVEPEVSVTQVKQILRKTGDEVRAMAAYRGTDIYYDVDPL